MGSRLVGRQRASRPRFEDVDLLIREGIVPEGSPDAMAAYNRQAAQLDGKRFVDTRTEASDINLVPFVAETPSFANSEYGPAALAEVEEKRVAALAVIERARAQKLAEVEKVFAAREAVARDCFYRYHRIKNAPPNPNPHAETCADVKYQYICARGFDSRSTVELDQYNNPTFHLGGYSREACARATDELDTNAQARHAMYVAQAKAVKG